MEMKQVSIEYIFMIIVCLTSKMKIMKMLNCKKAGHLDLLRKLGFQNNRKSVSSAVVSVCHGLLYTTNQTAFISIILTTIHTNLHAHTLHIQPPPFPKLIASNCQGDNL